MSAPTTSALGERALACGMRWMAGMRYLRAYRGAAYRLGSGTPERDVSVSPGHHEDAVPDIADPATQGCILAQAAERWAASNWAHETALTIVRVQGGWCWLLEHVRRGRSPEQIAVARRGPTVPTYGEACVSALEGSP